MRLITCAAPNSAFNRTTTCCARCRRLTGALGHTNQHRAIPSIMFIAVNRKASSSAITAYARTESHGQAVFSVVHALKPCFMFGASVSMRHATGRDAHAQSGCLPAGSLLTNQQRQSATRHRHVAGRPTAPSDQSGALTTSTNKQHAARTSRQNASSKLAVSTMVCCPRPKSFGTVQNVGSQIQGSAGMQGCIINIHRNSGVFSSALSPAQRLTRRSTGQQRAAHVAAG